MFIIVLQHLEQLRYSRKCLHECINVPHDVREENGCIQTRFVCMFVRLFVCGRATMEERLLNVTGMLTVQMIVELSLEG